VLLLFLAALAASGAGTTFAGFSATSSNSGDTFDAASDWVPPTVGATIIAKTAGGTPGAIHQGGTYYVYANVTDTGNPASGVATVTANTSNISTGQTAVPLMSGSFTIGGVTYGYRTGSVTVNASLAQGTYTYSITATDVAGNSGTYTGFTVTVDNTAPAGSDVQTANGGATVGKPEAGDQLTFSFSETIDPNSVLVGWTGPSINVVVRIIQGIPHDTFQVWNSTNTSQLPLGTVDLGGTGYVLGTATFGASGTPSTMVMSGSTITITLGTASGTTLVAVVPGTMSWPPSSALTDAAGNPCSTATVTESGALDVEF
jgi:hypothetical protein